MSKFELNLDVALDVVDRILDRQVAVEKRKARVQSAFLREVVAAVKGTTCKKHMGVKRKTGAKRKVKPGT